MEDRIHKIGLVAILVVGILVRLYVATALDGKAFNDTAIVGLMAMHELAGRFYAFYWGQSYMGATESLSIAPFFALFGVNEFSLSIGLLPWFVLFTIAVYALTELCGGLGVRDFDGAFAQGVVGLTFAAAVAVGTIVALTRLRGSWLALACGHVARAEPAASLFVLALITTVVYTECRPTTLRLERYLVPFATATLPLSAMAIDWLFERRRAVGASVLALVLVLYAREVFDLHRHFVETPTRFFAGRVDELSKYLMHSPIRFAYAEYGDAMITTFLTHDRVVVTDYQNRRYPIDEEKVEDPAVILYDKDDSGAERTLRTLDTEFERARVAGYRIYWPIQYDGVRRAPLAREGWKVSATTDAEDADLMLDGDPLTRWSAAPTGQSHPALTLDLGRSETVTGIYLGLGGQPTTAFRRLLVEVSSDGESWKLVKDASWDFPICFRPDGQVSVLPDDVQMVLFPPRPARWVRLTLLQAFPAQSWTVAELDVFGQAQGGPVFQPPRFADPSSFEVAERRLLREADRRPESNAALLALRELYRSHGDAERLAAIDRMESERFSPAVPLDWRFGTELELVGYDRKSVGPRAVELTYYWKAQRRMQGDYAAFVHVRGPRGQYQSDYVLGDAGHSTRSWDAGEIVKQTERLTIPQELPVGGYALEIGVWDPSDHHHLALGPWWHPAKSRDLLKVEVGPAGVPVATANSGGASSELPGVLEWAAEGSNLRPAD